jgi:NNP family nitrate/nitrite transporter-like MFS transporter
MNQALAPASAGQQQRALWLSTFAFTVCFAVWMIFSIIGIQISQQLGLNDTQFGLLIATPVLTGSVSRVFLGIWSDQFGGRKVMVLVMLCGAVATWMLTYAQTYTQFLIAALCVASPAATSRWAWPTSRSGSRPASRAPHWASSVPATSARR